MDLSKIPIPMLIVHHRRDLCSQSPYSIASALVGRLPSTPRKQLLTFDGGISTGDPCEAFSYHGFNGIEIDVVRDIARWMARP
jgi:hypothetical protein